MKKTPKPLQSKKSRKSAAAPEAKPAGKGIRSRKASKAPGIKVAEPVPGYLVAPIMGGLAATMNQLPASDLADILEVSPKTLTRWKKSGATLTPQQTDRMAHVEAILKHAEDIFKTSERVMEWMHSKVLYLNARRPIDVIKTETGRRQVDNALGVIEWGMF
jgi:putative toxin-antitoxin system antitoxin component (TIGR02293 family)